MFKDISPFLSIFLIGLALIALGKAEEAPKPVYPSASSIALQSLGSDGALLYSEHHPARTIGLTSQSAYDAFLGKDKTGLFEIRVQHGKVIDKRLFSMR